MKEREKSYPMLSKKYFPVLILILFTACSVSPEPIRYGRDQCHFCKMMISDVRYGAELVNKRGKAYKFDATECMIAYVKDQGISFNDFPWVMTVGYDTPKKLHHVKDVTFFISEELPSPMGANLSAFVEESSLVEIQQSKKGIVLTWEELPAKLNAMNKIN